MCALSSLPVGVYLRPERLLGISAQLTEDNLIRRQDFPAAQRSYSRPRPAKIRSSGAASGPRLGRPIQGSALDSPLGHSHDSFYSHQPPEDGPDRRANILQCSESCRRAETSMRPSSQRTTRGGTVVPGSHHEVTELMRRKKLKRLPDVTQQQIRVFMLCRFSKHRTVEKKHHKLNHVTDPQLLNRRRSLNAAGLITATPTSSTGGVTHVLHAHTSR